MRPRVVTTLPCIKSVFLSESIVRAVLRHPQQGKHRILAMKVGLIAVHRSVGEFSGVRAEWPSYIERLEFYFTANDVQENAKHHAILLSSCGVSTYELIRSLVDPSKPSNVAYEDIVEKVRAHHSPKSLRIVQRYKFNSRSQNPGESIACYVAELHRLSEHCGYGEQLQEMLRDRLVWGIADAHCQQRLLA